MNIIDRITNLGRTPLQQAAGATLSSAEQRLAQIADEITQAEADAQAQGLRQQATAALVAKLTEQAAAGALDDPARLAEALRQQREIASQAQEPATNRLNALRSEQERLQGEIHAHRRKAAQEEYSEACMAYAKACATLPAITERVRKAALAAGVTVNERNSPHLLDRVVQIGDALIDIPAEV